MSSGSSAARGRYGAAATGVVAVLTVIAVALVTALRGGADTMTSSAAAGPPAASSTPSNTPPPTSSPSPSPTATLTPSPAPTRSQRTSGRSTNRAPLGVPPPTAPDAACRVDLGYGVWAIDVVAARQLTTLAAVAHREGIPVKRAARVFDLALSVDGRTPPSPQEALDLLYHEPKGRPSAAAFAAVRALYRPLGMSCFRPQRYVPAQEELADGLTARAETLRSAFEDAYGSLPLGGFAPGGVDSGHVVDSAHYDGRAIDVFFTPRNADNTRNGWLLAHWLVAYSDAYQVLSVIWDDWIWTSWASDYGWRPYVHPNLRDELAAAQARDLAEGRKPAAVERRAQARIDRLDPTLQHRDHVHVAVEHGYPEDTPTPTPRPTRTGSGSTGDDPSAGEENVDPGSAPPNDADPGSAPPNDADPTPGPDGSTSPSPAEPTPAPTAPSLLPPLPTAPPPGQNSGSAR